MRKAEFPRNESPAKDPPNCYRLCDLADLQKAGYRNVGPEDFAAKLNLSFDLHVQFQKSIFAKLLP